jgi:hypothetical protein
VIIRERLSDCLLKFLNHLCLGFEKLVIIYPSARINDDSYVSWTTLMRSFAGSDATNSIVSATWLASLPREL